MYTCTALMVITVHLKWLSESWLEISAGHWLVNFSLCPANIVAYRTCMTGKFFYNKIRIRSGFFPFSRSSKPCKHCALSFKWNACNSNYTDARYIAAQVLSRSLLPLLKTIVLSITVQILSISMCVAAYSMHWPSVMHVLFPQTKMILAMAKKTIGSGSANSVQREIRARLRIIILFRM